jgi:hypothetical protein
MPIISQQLRLSTGEPLESDAYHAPGFGFFTVASASDGPRPWNERPYRLDRLHEIAELAGQQDTYISQAEFKAPKRSIANLARIRLLWADLDIYKLPEMKGKSKETIAAALLMKCDDLQLPRPSVIIDSGRGMYAKWFLAAPLPAAALPRWQLVQNIFCLKLKDYGADPRARDAARVLRAVGTINSKTGSYVRVVWQNSTPAGGGYFINGFIAYDFDTLANDQLPMTREELREKRAERELARETSTGNKLTLVSNRNTDGLRRFNPSQLARDRFNDITKLMALRGWQNGAPEGQRDMPIFLSAAFMAQAVVQPQLEYEIAAIAKRIAPTWTAQEIQSCVTTVVSKARAALDGHKVVFNGELRDPRYIFKTETLIDLLGITPEEEIQLTTIISKSEAKRRHAARSRKARASVGAVPRADYLAAAAQRRAAALAMHLEAKSWKEIGLALGVSGDAARQLVRAANKAAGW